MSISEKRVRTMIFFSGDQIAKLDAYSKKMGMTRSSLCVYFISQGLLRMDKTFALLRSISSEISDQMFDEVFDYV